MATAPIPTKTTLTKAEAAASTILKTSPIVLEPSAPAESKMKSVALPPRQIWVGIVSSVIAGFILQLLTTYANIDFESLATVLTLEPGTFKTALAGLIGFGIAWVTPPSIADVITHSTDASVKAAMKDPASNVSYALPPVQPPPGEPAVIVPPAMKA